MPTDAATDDDVESASLLTSVTNDSCGIHFAEIVPLTSHTDDPCIIGCDNGENSAEVSQEDFPVVKQEPNNVMYYSCVLQYRFCLSTASDRPCNQFFSMCVCLLVDKAVVKRLHPQICYSFHQNLPTAQKSGRIDAYCF